MSHLEPLQPSTFGPPPASYAHGIRAGNLIFVAGQVALGDDGQVVAPGDAREQTRVVLDRMRRVLAEAGASLSDVATTTVFLTDLSDYKAFNEAWATAFGDHRPTLALVRADLVRPGVVVEIQAIAVVAS